VEQLLRSYQLRRRRGGEYPYCYFAANGRRVALSFLTSTGARRRMSIVF
jgi:hypothetical protein